MTQSELEKLANVLHVALDAKFIFFDGKLIGHPDAPTEIVKYVVGKMAEGCYGLAALSHHRTEGNTMNERSELQDLQDAITELKKAGSAVAGGSSTVWRIVQHAANHLERQLQALIAE